MKFYCSLPKNRASWPAPFFNQGGFLNIQLKFFALIVYAASFCALLHGCASAPQLGKIPDGADVSIKVVAAANYPSTIHIQNTAVTEGLSTGIGAGGMAGGLWGLTCGPFALLCVPLGAAAGVVTGGAVGALVGATGMLSKENKAQVNDRLVRIEKTHPLLIELQLNVEHLARKHWILNQEHPKFHVNMEIQELQILSTRDGNLRFVLHILVSMQDTALNRKIQPRQKKYEYTSPPGSLAVWLNEQSDFLDTNLTSAIQQLSTQVIIDLANN